jgi:hypothetical protein
MHVVQRVDDRPVGNDDGARIERIEERALGEYPARRNAGEAFSPRRW